MHLEKNWLDYAGYGRQGVLTFDNHTNNRLEHFHCTLKSVLASSQGSDGTLIATLAKITAVCSVATAHQSFDKKFKTSCTIDPDI